MSDGVVKVLPIWRKGASAAERFAEFASYAIAEPQRFEKFVVAYEETLPNGNLKIRTFVHGAQLFEALGLFEAGKLELYKDSEQ